MTKKYNKNHTAALLHKFGVAKPDAFRLAKDIVDYKTTIVDVLLGLPDRPKFTITQDSIRCDVCDCYHGTITFKGRDGVDRTFNFDKPFKVVTDGHTISYKY